MGTSRYYEIVELKLQNEWIGRSRIHAFLHLVYCSQWNAYHMSVLWPYYTFAMILICKKFFISVVHFLRFAHTQTHMKWCIAINTFKFMHAVEYICRKINLKLCIVSELARTQSNILTRTEIFSVCLSHWAKQHQRGNRWGFRLQVWLFVMLAQQQPPT